MSLSRTPLRLLTAAGVTAGLLAVTALPALAHVTIDPATAEPGGYTSVDVRVPNEEADADTTKVELYLPTDHPIASVSVQPVPGWKIDVTRTRPTTPVKTDHGEQSEVVSKVTWSGGRIAPGEFQRFGLSLGPLPTGVRTLYFKALQTYTDPKDRTSVVRWIQLPDGGGEPRHPAPSITLNAPAAAPGAVRSGAATTTTSNGTATGLGIAGLVVALVALGLSAVAVRRSGARRTGAS